MNHPPAGAGKSSFDLIDGERFFDLLALAPTDSLLDLGCGQGRYSMAAASHIGTHGAIHAVDLWPEGVAALEAAARRRGLRQIQAHHCDAGQGLPLPAASVDICLMATVLHDLVADGVHRGALQATVRVLKPGGRLAIVEFAKRDGPPGPPRHIRLSPDEAEALLRPHGFALQRVTDLNSHLYLAQYRLGDPDTQRSAP